MRSMCGFRQGENGGGGLFLKDKLGAVNLLLAGLFSFSGMVLGCYYFKELCYFPKTDL